MSDRISEADLRDICDAIFRGRTIEAIKLYRQYSKGSGLKEAKDAVEELERKLRQASPEKFLTEEEQDSGQTAKSIVPGVQAGKGCFGMVALVVLVIVALIVAFFR